MPLQSMAVRGGSAAGMRQSLADVSGFIPLGNIRGNSENKRPAPETMERYSDTQLFALAKFLYALTPPPNPNRVSELTMQGEAVFAREGCGRCHTPPLYVLALLPCTDGSQTARPRRDRSAPECGRRAAESGAERRHAAEVSQSVAVVQ